MVMNVILAHMHVEHGDKANKIGVKIQALVLHLAPPTFIKGPVDIREDKVFNISQQMHGKSRSVHNM